MDDELPEDQLFSENIDMDNDQVAMDEVERIQMKMEQYEFSSFGHSSSKISRMELELVANEAEKMTMRRVKRRHLFTPVKKYGRVAIFVFAVTFYCILGGFLFEKLEAEYEIKLCNQSRAAYEKSLDQGVFAVDNIRTDFTLTNAERVQAFKVALETLKDAFVNSTWTGQDCDVMISNWNTFGAIVWCMTVITSIGYGHIAPKTMWGRVVCIVYPCFGIPLTLACLAKLGDVLADIAQFAYHVMCCCSICREQRRYLDDNDRKRNLRAYFKTNLTSFYFNNKQAVSVADKKDPLRKQLPFFFNPPLLPSTTLKL